MKKQLIPLGCAVIVLGFTAMLVVPAWREVFKAATAAHPYIMGFIKFALLATVGELIAMRINLKAWTLPAGLVPRALVWGFLGAVLALLFKMYAGGVTAAMTLGLLPGEGTGFLFAFFSSVMINCTFCPTMMVFHKVTDTAIAMKYAGRGPINLRSIAGEIDWSTLLGFTMAKTIPFFWIPAHTISFLLPGEYQIVMAAYLSIALGLILALGGKKAKKA
ncbi:MAG: hypothetical protein Q4C55_06915 [Eubacterium sp.]|nr:hypothetical protein [Eubacterium sp.]